MIDENLLLEIVDNQGWAFPLQHPLILDSKKAGDKIQAYLRLCQYINQDGQCVCGKELDNLAELHHALISRKDAMKLSNPDLIHSSFNTIMLHPNCHRKIRRALSLAFLVQIFKLSDIQQWYKETKSQMISNLRELEENHERFIF